jgi:CBS domain-containing protein
VLDAAGKLAGVIGRSKLLKLLAHASDSGDPSWLTSALVKTPVIAFPNEPLRNVVNRMAEVNLRCLPVVEEQDHYRLVGLISLEHLLRARVRNLQEERTRERILRLRLPLGGQSKVTSE